MYIVHFTVENVKRVCIDSFAGANGATFMHCMLLFTGYRVQRSCNRMGPLLVAAANCIYHCTDIQKGKPMEHPPGQQVTVSMKKAEEGWVKSQWGTNVFSYSMSHGTVMALFLTDAGLLSVVVDAFAVLFFQNGLLQIIIQGSQQVVHVSLVSLQHQFCHTSEGLKEGGSEK